MLIILDIIFGKCIFVSPSYCIIKGNVKIKGYIILFLHLKSITSSTNPKMFQILYTLMQVII